MAFEPETAKGDEDENTELADMTRRFRIAVVLTTPVLLLEIGGHVLISINGYRLSYQIESILFWLRRLYSGPDGRSFTGDETRHPVSLAFGDNRCETE
jgi:hypothetical protein